MKCKICHGKSEEKGEFGNFSSEFLKFKCGTPIMLGLDQFFGFSKINDL